MVSYETNVRKSLFAAKQTALVNGNIIMHFRWDFLGDDLAKQTFLIVTFVAHDNVRNISTLPET